MKDSEGIKPLYLIYLIDNWQKINWKYPNKCSTKMTWKLFNLIKCLVNCIEFNGVKPL